MLEHSDRSTFEPAVVQTKKQAGPEQAQAKDQAGPGPAGSRAAASGRSSRPGSGRRCGPARRRGARCGPARAASGDGVKQVRELASVVDRVAEDVAAGASWHQSAGERLRSRSISRSSGVETVRGYQPFNAVVLHAQLVERGLAGGSGEFVTEHQCTKLGGEVLEAVVRPEDRFVLESGDRRGIAVGIAGSPGVVLRPGAYRVLHSETQTTLDPGGEERVRGSRECEAAARDTVTQVLAGAGARLEPADRVEYGRDGDGLVVCHPGLGAYPSPAAWASSVVAAAAAAVSDDLEAHGAVRLARFDAAALKEHNARARRAKSGSPSRRGRPRRRGRRRRRSRRSTRVRADSWRGARTCRSSGSVRPAGRCSIPSGGRSGRRRRGLFKGHGVRQWEAFRQAALVGLCRAVGTESERSAAAAARWRRSPGGLAVVEAVAGPLPGLDHRPALSGDERRARADLVGGLAARSVVEAAGLRYVPVARDAECASREAAVLRREGLRSVCADASNIGAWALDRDRAIDLPAPAEGVAARAVDADAPAAARPRRAAGVDVVSAQPRVVAVEGGSRPARGSRPATALESLVGARLMADVRRGAAPFQRDSDGWGVARLVDRRPAGRAVVRPGPRPAAVDGGRGLDGAAVRRPRRSRRRRRRRGCAPALGGAGARGLSRRVGLPARVARELGRGGVRAAAAAGGGRFAGRPHRAVGRCRGRRSPGGGRSRRGRAVGRGSGSGVRRAAPPVPRLGGPVVGLDGAQGRGGDVGAVAPRRAGRPALRVRALRGARRGGAGRDRPRSSGRRTGRLPRAWAARTRSPSRRGAATACCTRTRRARSSWRATPPA